MKQNQNTPSLAISTPARPYNERPERGRKTIKKAVSMDPFETKSPRKAMPKDLRKEGGTIM